MSVARSRTSNEMPSGSIGRKLRLRRKVRGLSLQEIADRSGISIGQLSQIERDISSPSLRSLRLICSALDMPMGWLFDSGGRDADEEDPVVVRSENRRILDLNGKGMVKELLTPDSCPAIQMMFITLRPGGSSGEKAYNNSEGAKCGTVLEGTLGLEVNGRSYTLETGDSFAFEAVKYHRFWCAGDRDCRVAWVVAPAIY
ncbi:cupin domain-containing protein [Fodinicurvata fenggangensis]|uniref:cupin domain-containing protein n=1 Tax=Fodinicurvata fenggangensis TaxID=1121830 RepID=UPI00047EB9B2|nr:cupin domain-containing protein [Fodinicurvata fenggangensis]